MSNPYASLRAWADERVAQKRDCFVAEAFTLYEPFDRNTCVDTTLGHGLLLVSKAAQIRCGIERSFPQLCDAITFS